MEGPELVHFGSKCNHENGGRKQRGMCDLCYSRFLRKRKREGKGLQNTGANSAPIGVNDLDPALIGVNGLDPAPIGVNEQLNAASVVKCANHGSNS